MIFQCLGPMEPPGPIVPCCVGEPDAPGTAGPVCARGSAAAPFVIGWMVPVASWVPMKASGRLRS